jgi:ABC-2 type transport system permease protein
MREAKSGGAGMANDLIADSAAWGGKQVREQLWAIAWLRWRILMNGFRRKGSVGDIVALAITVPIFALMGLSVALGAGGAAWYVASHGMLDRVAWVLWGTFGLCQLLNINVGQPGTTFDPTQLIRFPLRARNYVFIRLFFGILSPANVMVALMSVAIAAGVGVAMPALWMYALVGMTVFAVTNAVFTRMVFAWVDRWLSTRRAREVFTALIFVGSMGIQWANFTFNPAYGRHHHNHSAHWLTPKYMGPLMSFGHRAMPLLELLPPGLVGGGLVAAHRGNPVVYVGDVADCLLFALVFFAIFALRTRTEYRGEVFSDQANGVRETGTIQSQASSAILPTPLVGGVEGGGRLGVQPTISAVFAKEILTVRRNSGVFYALVAPVLVVLFMTMSRMISSGNSAYIFPAALAYALIGVVPLAFNSFGLEGAGCQFYFFAPVRLRDVFLAKNLINILLAYVEAAAVLVVVTVLGRRPTGAMLTASVLWAAATLMITLTFGNRRSIAGPKKIDLGRTSSKQAAPLSALLSIGLVALSAAAGAGMLLVVQSLKEMWLLPVGMVGYCALAAVVYWRGLASIERYALEHREEMFGELCKGK